MGVRIRGWRYELTALSVVWIGTRKIMDKGGGMSEMIEQVVVDVECLGCGYNLRMQDAEGRCPECGARVRWSLEETAMRWGTEYLRRLAARVRWVALTAVGVPVAFVGGTFLQGILLRFLDPLSSPMENWSQRNLVSLLSMFPGIAAVLLHVVAVWRVAGAPPGGQLNRHQVLMRIGALMLFAAVVELMLQMILSIPGYSDTGIELLQFAQFLWPVLLLGIALFAQQGAEVLADIARRTGQRVKAGFSMWGLWLFSGGILLLDGLLVLSLLSMTGRSHSLAANEQLMVLLGLGGVGMTLLGLIASTIALFRFSGRMRALAAVAPVAGAPLTELVGGVEADTWANDAAIGNPWLH